MAEPLSAAVISFFVENLAAPILLSLPGQATGAAKEIGDDVKQLLYKASNAYYKNFSERHGQLKVLGMSRPTSLDDIYVKVRLLDRSSVQMFESIDAIEETFRAAKQRSFGRMDCETKTGYEVANSEQYLMVLGGPGAGKSTFLRKMGMEALQYKQERGFHHDCIPVFVELKRFKKLKIDIESHIAKEFETCGFPKSKEFTEAALKQGKLLVLLDGLDEVPTANRSEAVAQIQDFVDRYSKNRFIASCRIAAYNQNFRRFTDVGVAEFDDEQIRDFIGNWFGKGRSRANDCWEEVTKAASVGVKELAQTPLLLTLVCLLFEKGGELPVKRATLYDRALRVLLEEWNASKELERDKPYKGLDTRAKELLLATIAFDFFEEDRLFFPRRELARKIETVLKDEILPDEKRVDGNVVLKAIEIQHGILAERGTDIYSFSHLTLQEFLTAVQIADNPSKYLNQAIENHLFDERWKEVFLLLVGAKQADDVLLAMESRIKSSVISPKIKKIIAWAEEITKGSKGKYYSAAKRGMAISIAVKLSGSRDHYNDYVYSSIKRSALPKKFTFANEAMRPPLKEGTLKRDRYDSFFQIDLSLYLSLSLDLDLGYSIYHALLARRQHYESLPNRRVHNFLYGYLLANLTFFDLNFFYGDYSLSQTISRYISFSRTRALELFQVYKESQCFNDEMFFTYISEVRELFKQAPKDNLSKKQIIEDSRQLTNLWITAFSLQREWIDLSDGEINEFKKYLYSNQLLLDCRNAAVRLSRDVREGILERMLTL